MNPLSIPRSRKPRNPMVAAAFTRKAGVHLRSRAGQRQRDSQALRRELMATHSSWPSSSP